MRNKYKKILAILTLAIIFTAYLQYQKANAADPDFITSVDVMKWTKDTLRNQPSDSEINAIVSDITSNLKPKYIAISVPMDDQAAYPADQKPAPRSAADFTQVWVNAIHKAGAKVIFRGTWSGIEGIYGFKKLLGSDRFPAGTASSAPTDGENTWLGKTYAYIVNHPLFFSAGDIWAALPERTEGIFSDSTSFLSADGAGLQANYANFFIDFNKVSTAAFSKIGKAVETGYTANNFSEIASGWLLPSLFANQSVIAVDHYGINHTPAEMDSDIRSAYKKYGKQIFLQEWGDYWDTSMSQTDRQKYLDDMYAVFAKLAADKILAGFNYWGGWVNSGEGVLTQSGNTFGVNYRGDTLAKLFATISGTTVATTTDTTTPTPTPTSEPTQEPAPTSNTSTSSEGSGESGVGSTDTTTTHRHTTSTSSSSDSELTDVPSTDTNFTPATQVAVSNPAPATPPAESIAKPMIVAAVKDAPSPKPKAPLQNKPELKDPIQMQPPTALPNITPWGALPTMNGQIAANTISVITNNAKNYAYMFYIGLIFVIFSVAYCVNLVFATS